MTTHHETHLSIPEAAAEAGVPVSKVRRLVAADAIPFVTIWREKTSRHLIPESAIDAIRAAK